MSDPSVRTLSPMGTSLGILSGENRTWDDMANFTKPGYSKSKVVKAGKFLRGTIPADEIEPAIEAFRVAHNWRASHAVPMRQLRSELVGKIRSRRLDSPTVSRLKRMASIRKKLSLGRVTLYQMQDIAGCRAIMPDMSRLRELTDHYENGGSVHEYMRTDNYAEDPKAAGYRCVHLIMKFKSRKPDFDSFRNQNIEIQLRTKLQHTWATAVEAVGLYNHQDMKGGQGEQSWLRLFALMGSEFSVEEGCALVPGTPDDKQKRRKEIRELATELNAVSLLQSFADVVKYTESVGRRSQYFELTYNEETGEVFIQGHQIFNAASSAYEVSEKASGSNTVLIEADRVEDLKVGFPNYFLDVREFVKRLSYATMGQDAPKTYDLGSLSNLRRKRR